MKKLKLPIIVCVSLVAVLIYGLLQACWWSPYGEDLRFNVFNPHMAGMAELEPFIFTTDRFFENNNSLVFTDSLYYKNTDEWVAYTKGAVKGRDVYNVMYKIDPVLFFDTLASIQNKNTFIKYLKAKDTAAFTYLCYAKRCEHVVNSPDPWADDNSSTIDKDAAERLIKEGEDMYKNSKSAFLKLHIAFQLERLLFYSGPSAIQQDDKTKVYEQKILTSKINSWIKGTAFFYSTISQNDSLMGYDSRIKCNYALAKAFDKAVEKRARCVDLSFHKQLPATLALAKNNHERTVIQTMYELQNPGIALAGMQTIYNEEPGSRFLPFLLMREVNKLEDWITGYEISGHGSSSYYLRTDVKFTNADSNDGSWLVDINPVYSIERRTKDIQYLNKVTDFITKVITDGYQPDKALLKLMITHLRIVAGDTAGAKLAMKDAESCSLNESEREQIFICQLMLNIIAQPKPDSITERMIMQLPLSTKREDDYDNTLHSLSSQLLLYAGKKMIEHGNYAQGLLLLDQTDSYIGEFDFSEGEMNTYIYMYTTAQPKQYEEVYSLLTKPDKTPFEKYLCGKLIRVFGDDYGEKQSYELFDKNRVLNFEAIYYINHDNLDSALSVLNRIPDKLWTKYPYEEFKHRNPFKVEYTSLYNDSSTLDMKHVWNPKLIVKYMIALRNEAEANVSKKATDYEELANAYYNISFYGKWWIMSNPWRSSSEIEYRKHTLHTFDRTYYGSTNAEKYYLLAAQSGHDFETTAFCYYMAGQCHDNYKSLAFYAGLKGNDWSFYKSDGPYQYARLMKIAFPDLDKRLSARDTTDCTLYEDFLVQADKLSH